MNVEEMSLKQKIRLSINTSYFSVGLILLLLGLILSLSIGVNYSATLAFLYKPETTKGILIAKERTNIHVDRSKWVKKYTYSFHLSNGEEINGYSYKASNFKQKVLISENDSVNIQYSKFFPTINRIENTTRSKSGFIGQCFGVILLLGILWIWVCLYKGAKRLNLLLNGIQSYATLKSIEPTDTKILGKTIYKLHYSFVSNDGQKVEFIQKSSETEHLNIDSQCIVYYSVNKPQNSFAITANDSDK